MTEKEYKRLRERDARGRLARLTRDVSNYHVTIRAGTVVELGGKHGGFDVQSTPCPCCRTTYFVRKVSWTALELLPAGPPPAASAPPAPSDSVQLDTPLDAPRADP